MISFKACALTAFITKQASRDSILAQAYCGAFINGMQLSGGPPHTEAELLLLFFSL